MHYYLSYRTFASVHPRVHSFERSFRFVFLHFVFASFIHSKGQKCNNSVRIYALSALLQRSTFSQIVCFRTQRKCTYFLEKCCKKKKNTRTKFLLYYKNSFCVFLFHLRWKKRQIGNRFFFLCTVLKCSELSCYLCIQRGAVSLLFHNLSMFIWFRFKCTFVTPNQVILHKRTEAM